MTAREDAADSPIGEFELIERFFKRSTRASPHLELGIGDDCALLSSKSDEQWAVSVDTLIEGVHFFGDVDAAALGHKALAVNLSDLAACGATPRCFFLALALPRVDPVWLGAFSDGLHALADSHQCVLAGGDTTRSPNAISITITAMGTVPSGRALLRSGARVGDDLWVSGQLGDAALGLAFHQAQLELPPADAQYVIARLERPTPRVQLGQRMRGIASSAIDVSDGLAGDLHHILRASGVGAAVEWSRLPRSAALQRQPVPMQQRCALTGGDDYELLFTAPASGREEVLAAAGNESVTRIGAINDGNSFVVLDERGAPVDTGMAAYDHFKR